MTTRRRDQDRDDGCGVRSARRGSRISATPKGAPRAFAKRAKNPNDPLKLVIVRDMWLTGFDAPCMHTMYIDKPMKGTV